MSPAAPPRVANQPVMAATSTFCCDQHLLQPGHLRRPPAHANANRADLLLTGCRTPPAEEGAPARILRSRSLARRNALRSGRPHYRTAHTSCPTSPLATRVVALPCSAHSWVPVEAR